MDERDEVPGEDDAVLYRRLQAAEFTGPDQADFDAALVVYAHPVLMAWIWSGTIFVRCAGEGRAVRVGDTDRDLLRRDEDERRSLADETVACALVTFTRYALLGGGWRADGGRSLRSYYVTACIREFPGVYRRWSTERRRQGPWEAYGLGPPDDDGPGRAAPDHADDVVGRLSTTQELENMPSQVREIVQGLIDEESFDQIGARLGMSARAVEGRLYRYRRTIGGRR